MSLCLLAVAFTPAIAAETSKRKASKSLAYDFLECSVFYETYGAYKSSNKRAADKHWAKSDYFRTLAESTMRTVSTLNEDEFQTRKSYMVKKWSRLLLDASRMRNKKNNDIKTWTSFCDDVEHGRY